MASRSKENRPAGIVGLFPLAAIVSGAVAYNWPITQNKAQPEFFVSVASAILAVLGIGFALLVLGAQLGSTSGRANARHVFGSATWFYLGLLLVAAFSSFALGYYAKEPGASVEPCMVGADYCVSQVTIARVVLGIVVMSIVLLIPFAQGTLFRVSPVGIFTSNANRLILCRSRRSLDLAIAYFAEDLEFASQDRTSFKIGIRYLEDASMESIQKRPFLSSVQSEDIAKAVSKLFNSLNVDLADRPHARDLALEAHTRWLGRVTADWSYSPAFSLRLDRIEISAETKAELIRNSLEKTVRHNLRDWAEGETVPYSTALLTIRLATNSCHDCASERLKVKFSDVGRLLAEKFSTTSPAEKTVLNLTLSNIGELLFAAERASGQVNLGQKSLWSSCNRVLQLLSDDHELAKSVGSWVIRDLHRVIDTACRTGFDSSREGAVVSTAAYLRRGQLSNIILGPSGHNKCKNEESHALWMPELMKYSLKGPQSNWEEIIDANVRRVKRSGDAAQATALLLLMSEMYALAGSQDWLNAKARRTHERLTAVVREQVSKSTRDADNEYDAGEGSTK